jgi:hypothetical protein
MDNAMSVIAHVFSYAPEVKESFPPDILGYAVNGIHELTGGTQLPLIVVEASEESISHFCLKVRQFITEDRGSVMTVLAPEGWIDGVRSNSDKFELHGLHFRESTISSSNKTQLDIFYDFIGEAVPYLHYHQVSIITERFAQMSLPDEIIQSYGFRSTVKLEPLISDIHARLGQFSTMLTNMSWSGILVRPPEEMAAGNRIIFRDLVDRLDSDEIPNIDRKVAGFWNHFLSGLESISESLVSSASEWKLRGESLDLALDELKSATDSLDDKTPNHLTIIGQVYTAWVSYLKIVRVDGYKDEQIEKLKPIVDLESGISPIPIVKAYVESDLPSLLQKPEVISLLNSLPIAPRITEIDQSMRYHLYSEYCQYEMLSATIRQRDGQDENSWIGSAEKHYDLAQEVVKEPNRYISRVGGDLPGHLRKLGQALNDFINAGIPPLINIDAIQFIIPFAFDEVRDSVTLKSSIASRLRDNKLQLNLADIGRSLEIHISDPIFDGDYWDGDLVLDAQVFVTNSNFGVIVCKMRTSQLQTPFSLRDLIAFGRMFEEDSSVSLNITSPTFGTQYTALSDCWIKILAEHWVAGNLAVSPDVRMLAYVKHLSGETSVENIRQLLNSLGLANFAMRRGGTKLQNQVQVVSDGENMVISPRLTVTVANTTDNELFLDIFVFINIWDHGIDQIWDRIDNGRVQGISEMIREIRLSIRHLTNNIPALKAEGDHMLSVYKLQERLEEATAFLG